MDSPESRFRPGFRWSAVDALVLLAGAGGTALLWPHSRELAFICSFVVGHFFLFCNVFRIGRLPELVWAGVFLLLASGTLLAGTPSLFTTASSTLFLSLGLIMREMRLPRYHGVLWQKVNPGLPQWWQSRRTDGTAPRPSSGSHP